MTSIVSTVRQGAGRLHVRRITRGCLWIAIGAVALSTTVAAQGGRRSRQELVEKLEGRAVMVDRATSQRRPITTAEAGAFVDRIGILTAPAASASAAEVLSRGGLALRVSAHGPGHVVVSRPNADGSTSARCVTSVDEAVDFLAGELDDAAPVQ